MNVIFLGTLISEVQRKFFLDNGIPPQPADIAQSYILKGLDKCNNVDHVFAITSPRISAYGENKILKVQSSSFNLLSVPVITCGYLNLPYISIVHRESNYKKYCRNWAKHNKQLHNLTIMIYSLNSTFLKGAKEIKKIIPSAKICVVVADLPDFMSNYKGLKGFLKKIDILRIDQMRKIVDKYILYTKYMAEYLNLKDNQWIVVEGFYDTDCIKNDRIVPCNEKKICVYAGDLSPEYGIQNMIDAFDKCEVNYQLDIYGNPSIIKQYRLNDNVCFKGLVEPSDLKLIFKKADLLINPRPSNLKLTKYSFPSKTFEYMASGTPIVMCRLKGIPSEYFNHMFFFDDETSIGMRNKIHEILSMEDQVLYQFGKEAAKFLIIEKSIDTIMKRIIVFCED